MDQPLEQLEQLQESAGSMIGDLVYYAVMAVVLAVVLYIVWKILTGRKRKLFKEVPELTIDVTSLGTGGLPPGAPVLEHYNVPVRLAAVVLAPAGRARQLPPPDQLDGVFDAIVPGLPQVVSAHTTLIRRWPAQLSTSGFVHVFSRHVTLPGDAGKGTCWCAAAGVAKSGGQPVMVGLVMRTESPNGFGQAVVERETGWLDILRIKRAE